MSDQAVSQTTEETTFDIKAANKAVLETLSKEREQEIVARRFGLYDRKETLEQVGELLGITRERVRQLEKAIVSGLKAAGSDLPKVKEAEAAIIEKLEARGGSARVKDLVKDFIDEPARDDHNHLTLLGTIAPGLTVLDENDDFYQSLSIAKYYDTKSLKEAVTNVKAVIKKNAEPLKAEGLHELIPSLPDPLHATALASLSRGIATLNGDWGLIKWPLVNPKNIRDKIYLILRDSGKAMHFNDIAKAIKDSDFKRKDVTQQAIHNELIKDKRFVLIGRGIYALKEWGYKKGIVSDVIEEVLRKADEPLHRDEIVKRVLKRRVVKEATILLNLQGKPQFKRVAKATYTIAEPEEKTPASKKTAVAK